MENFEIQLKLNVAQINTILKYLGGGAYVEVSDLINSLHDQARSQIAQATPPASIEPEAEQTV